MKRFDWRRVTVFVVIFLIICGVVVLFRLQKNRIQQSQVVMPKTTSLLPPAAQVVDRSETIHHGVLESDAAEVGQTRVQVRGIVVVWQKNELVVNAKGQMIKVLFSDQVQFEAKPLTMDYPGGEKITLNKVYINYLHNDGMGVPKTLKETTSLVRVGDEILVLALRDSDQLYQGHVLVLFKDRK